MVEATKHTQNYHSCNIGPQLNAAHPVLSRRKSKLIELVNASGNIDIISHSE